MIHLSSDCPMMNKGDGVFNPTVDEMLDALDFEEEEPDHEEVSDCVVCVYASRIYEDAWLGGFLNGLQATLYDLDEMNAAIAAGFSKVQVFRQLKSNFDPDLGSHPQFLPLLIMTREELEKYCCTVCGEATDFLRSEDGTDKWACHRCGHEISIPFQERIG